MDEREEEEAEEGRTAGARDDTTTAFPVGRANDCGLPTGETGGRADNDATGGGEAQPQEAAEGGGRRGATLAEPSDIPLGDNATTPTSGTVDNGIEGGGDERGDTGGRAMCVSSASPAPANPGAAVPAIPAAKATFAAPASTLGRDTQRRSGVTASPLGARAAAAAAAAASMAARCLPKGLSGAKRDGLRRTNGPARGDEASGEKGKTRVDAPETAAREEPTWPTGVDDGATGEEGTAVVAIRVGGIGVGGPT